MTEYLEDLCSSSDEEDPAPPPEKGTPPPPETPPEDHRAFRLQLTPVAPPGSEEAPPSPTPSYEVIVQQGGRDVIPSRLHIALGLWCEKSGCSRTDYVRLREILQLSKPSTATATATETDSTAADEDSKFDALPKKLDSLKRQVRRHIPLLKLYRKPLTVVVDKQPSLPEHQKGEQQRQSIERKAWQYWYDPLDLVRTILSATHLRAKMFFGMAHYVDKPMELWHSQAWGSSIRTTSGEVCYTSEGQIIVPGDLVRIHSTPWRVGRVLFIGRDYRSQAAEIGATLITLQAVAEQRRLPHILHPFSLQDNDTHEMFIIEDILLELSVESIIRHLNVYLDREFNVGDDETVFLDNRFFIRRVLTMHSYGCRPLRLLHPTRGELEVAHFGREHIEAFNSNPYFSLPYLLFIDDFGIHRNMYRALKAFYLIPACLPFDERRKLANIFTLTLGPHGANINDVVEAFRRPIQELDHGTRLEISGQEQAVWAFGMTLLGDMPQQADNAGFLRHTAKRGCRTCYCTTEEKADLEFDTVLGGRYHWDTEIQRQEAQDLDTAAEMRRFTERTGIRVEPSAITKLVPALDLIQSRAYDAPHSEWRGLGRILQGFLMTSILSKRGASAYLKAFQKFRFPPGWKRIQSPAFYIWSWSLSEAGRAALLTPLILRCQSTIGWYRLPFLQAVERQTGNTGVTPMNTIIRHFACIAQSATLVGSQRYTDPATLHQLVLDGRQAYQRLISYAMPASVGGSHRPEALDADDTDDDGILHEMLPDALEEDEVLPQRNPRANPRTNKFNKLLKLPNVHAGLHLAGNAKEYATVMNSNVLAGELKHK